MFYYIKEEYEARRKSKDKNLLDKNSKYEEIDKMHSPKKMLKLINKTSDYGALTKLGKEYNKKILRDCQYEAELNLEKILGIEYCIC